MEDRSKSFDPENRAEVSPSAIKAGNAGLIDYFINLSTPAGSSGCSAAHAGVISATNLKE